MQLVWAPQAKSDLDLIYWYTSKDDPEAAVRLVNRIVLVVEEQLTAMPEVGRPGRVPDTRELVISGTPFIVPYRIKGDSVEIARVYHAARKWPDRLRGRRLTAAGGQRQSSRLSRAFSSGLL